MVVMVMTVRRPPCAAELHLHIHDEAGSSSTCSCGCARSHSMALTFLYEAALQKRGACPGLRHCWSSLTLVRPSGSSFHWQQPQQTAHSRIDLLVFGNHFGNNQWCIIRTTSYAQLLEVGARRRRPAWLSREVSAWAWRWYDWHFCSLRLMHLRLSSERCWCQPSNDKAFVRRMTRSWEKHASPRETVS